MAEQPLEDLFARLAREQRDADRLYNDALTAVDHAIQATPQWPGPPRPYDDRQVTSINRSWNILPDGPPPVDRSLKGRLRAFIWRLVGLSLETQKQFNAAVVDHLNRNVAAHHEGQQAIVALLDDARREFEALVRFESLLVQYLQTITAYVDTKDRSTGATELRERLVLSEQRIVSVKREVERILANDGRPVLSTPQTAADTVFGGKLDSLTYVGFEDRFRGSQDDIRTRLNSYMPILKSTSDVLDVGCGRGELLDLLRQNGVKARGIDVNHAMVELCRARGLDAEEADAVSYLERQQDDSLGGLVAIQVVEHFEPGYLMRFLETAHQKLRSGAPLILETINPACWMAFFETYLRDLTHQRPLHAETLRYLVQASGFTNADVQYREPVRDDDRLDRVPTPDSTVVRDPAITSLVTTVNAHADKLNARLFSSMDYVVIACR